MGSERADSDELAKGNLLQKQGRHKSRAKKCPLKPPEKTKLRRKPKKGKDSEVRTAQSPHPALAYATETSTDQPVCRTATHPNMVKASANTPKTWPKPVH